MEWPSFQHFSSTRLPNRRKYVTAKITLDPWAINYSRIEQRKIADNITLPRYWTQRNFNYRQWYFYEGNARENIRAEQEFVPLNDKRRKMSRGKTGFGGWDKGYIYTSTRPASRGEFRLLRLTVQKKNQFFHLPKLAKIMIRIPNEKSFIKKTIANLIEKMEMQTLPDSYRVRTIWRMNVSVETKSTALSNKRNDHS